MATLTALMITVLILQAGAVALALWAMRLAARASAIDLFDSAPVLARRDLGNARAAMLRPRGLPWFHADIIGWVDCAYDERLSASILPEARVFKAGPCWYYAIDQNVGPFPDQIAAEKAARVAHRVVS